MRIDCHLHTRRYSACSRLAPEDACNRALKRGLDAVVITEHQRQWPSWEFEELRQSFPDLALYNGFEATLDNDTDIVVITESKEIEIPFGISPENFLASSWFHEETCFLFFAHLFRWNRHLPDSLKELAPYVHGLEMNSINILRGQFQRENERYRPLREALYLETRDRFGLQELFNSDAHDTAAVGSLANEIPCSRPPASETELASLLKQSVAREYQDPALLQGQIRF